MLRGTSEEERDRDSSAGLSPLAFPVPKNLPRSCSVLLDMAHGNEDAENDEDDAFLSRDGRRLISRRKVAVEEKSQTRRLNRPQASLALFIRRLVQRVDGANAFHFQWRHFLMRSPTNGRSARERPLLRNRKRTFFFPTPSASERYSQSYCTSSNYHTVLRSVFRWLDVADC